MVVSNFYANVMGSAFVYDRLRPMLLGGFDFSEVYGWLGAGPADVIFDIGCGTGQALDYVSEFDAFHGFDLDANALAHLRRKHASDRVHTESRRVGPEDVERLAPTKVILMGIFHHLSDEEVAEILEILMRGESVRRIITLDPVYRDGKYLNNLLGWLDRGRYVRTEEGYRAVIARAPLRIRESVELRSGNGAARYFATCLIPEGRSA